jgi:hypothetical protein
MGQGGKAGITFYFAQNRQLLENRFPVVSRDFDCKIKSDSSFCSSCHFQ